MARNGGVLLLRSASNGMGRVAGSNPRRARGHAPPPTPGATDGTQYMRVLGLVLTRQIISGRQDLRPPVLSPHLEGYEDLNGVGFAHHSAASSWRGVIISRMTPAMPSVRRSMTRPSAVTVTRRTSSWMMRACLG